MVRRGPEWRSSRRRHRRRQRTERKLDGHRDDDPNRSPAVCVGLLPGARERSRPLPDDKPLPVGRRRPDRGRTRPRSQRRKDNGASLTSGREASGERARDCPSPSCTAPASFLPSHHAPLRLRVQVAAWALFFSSRRPRQPYLRGAVVAQFGQMPWIRGRRHPSRAGAGAETPKDRARRALPSNRATQSPTCYRSREARCFRDDASATNHTGWAPLVRAKADGSSPVERTSRRQER
jgi:hypothetical protein